MRTVDDRPGARALGHDPASPADGEPPADDAGDGRGAPWWVPPSGLWAALMAVCLLGLGAVGARALTAEGPGAPSAVDLGFTRDMLAHHAQAIEMAVAASDADDPVVANMAREILVFQNREMGAMYAWLRDWDESAADPDGEAMGWMGVALPVEAMPGMATADQLAELRAAPPDEVGTLFLELMMVHHRGGIHMAERAAEEARDAHVRDLAAYMARTQAIEINEYLRYAANRGTPIDAEPVPVPRPEGTPIVERSAG